MTTRLSSKTPSKIHPAKNGFITSYTPLSSQQVKGSKDSTPESVVKDVVREEEQEEGPGEY